MTQTVLEINKIVATPLVAKVTLETSVSVPATYAVLIEQGMVIFAVV